MRRREHGFKHPEAKTYRQIYELSRNQPDVEAYQFYGKKTTYLKLLQKIDKIMRGFRRFDISEENRIIICLPEIPQLIDCLYAVDKLNLNAQILHPDTSAPALAVIAEEMDSKAIITTEKNYEKVAKAIAGLDRPVQLILADIRDELPGPLKVIYSLFNRKKQKFAPDEYVITWADFAK